MVVIDQIGELSRKKLSKDGILFILWGWLMFYTNMAGYIERSYLLRHTVEKLLNTIGFVAGILVIILTIAYFLIRRKSVINRIGTSVRYVWFTLFGALVLINLIQGNVLHSINLELQHSIFMVVIGFAIVTTGNILKSRVFTYGGILFGILGFLASYLPLAQQLVLEAVGWLLAIIVPGHLLYANKKLI